MDNYTQDQLTNVDIQIDDEVKQQFGEMAKWAKFISVVIFVLAGIILIFGVLGGAAMMTIFNAYGGGMFDTITGLGGLGAGIVIAIVVLAVFIMSVIYYFLFRFANKVKIALATEDVLQLNAALNALKIFFIIMTIIGIIGILLSLIRLF